MTKLVHCADLHLTANADKNYSMNVLKEIIAHSNNEKSNYLLFCGDTFDSFPDLEALAGDFHKSLADLDSSCKIILLSGNHEDHNRKDRKITDFINHQNMTIIDSHDRPFRLIHDENIEFLAIPHQQNYSDYTEWQIEPKKSKFRIALAHGIIPNMVYTGGDEDEEKAGVMDIDLFNRHGVDYAALGHIHSKRQLNHETKCVLAYSGAPRVRAKGESGLKSVNVVTCGEQIIFKEIPVAASGQYREYDLNIGLDGKLNLDLSALAANWDVNDWVHINFNGMVESKESCLKELKKEIELLKENKYRKITFDTDSLEDCSGISSQEIAKKFLELLEKKKPANIGNELDIWERARALGLKKIKENLRASS